MVGYIGNIEEETLNNTNFRKVLYTGAHAQLVVMHLNPSEDIGEEVHETTDQFIRVEKGSAKAILNGEEHALSDGFVIIIPAGTKHNVINTSSSEPLKLYTIYSPSHHKDGVIHKTKQDAENDTSDHL